MLDEGQDREHLGNKIGRDAAKKVLEDLRNNFPDTVIPYEIEDTWVENVYNAIGNTSGCKLIMRLRFNTYKEINVCRPVDTYWKTGYQSQCLAFSFKTNDLVSEMYNIIRNELSTQLKGHKLYRIDSAEFTKPKFKDIKIKTDSNLLLLL
jgi:glycosidase